MPCVPMLRFCDRQERSRPEAGEIKSGFLEILRSNQSASSKVGQRVFVRVYKTSSEHFAVLFPCRALITACRPIASINLRSCTVDPLPGSGKEFRVTPKPCEGVALDFCVPDDNDQDKDGVKSWIVALTIPEKSHRKRTLSDPRTALPVLAEEEEN